MFKINFYYVWSLTLLISSIIFLTLSLKLLLIDYRVMYEWNLLSLNSLSVTYIVYLDWMSMIFSFVVFFISSIVILYRRVYIGEYNYGSVRFILLVLLFVFRILLIVLRPRLIRILLGWDGLGLVSYCLVIYYHSIKRYLAGIITCLINRLGDIRMLISIGWVFSYGRWNFILYLDLLDNKIFWAIIIASFTRRAQIPFSMWLPAAIAAPTPVSSLVHSSTLVTAGVYLLIRFNSSLIFRNDLLLFISLITIIMSSFCASYEYDLKKVIALSTLSQLGLMISCLFIGLIDLSFFHLLSHAIFKSLLFLCSGVIIHLMGGCQDIRFIGSICLIIPLTCCCFNISRIALIGFPFLSGFYSKDFIIEIISFGGLNMYIIIVYYLSLGLTSFYRIRLFYYRFLVKFNYLRLRCLGEDISLMKYRIIFLSFFSVSFGCIYMWLLNLDLGFLLIPVHLRVMSLLIVRLGLFLGYEFSNFIYLMGYRYYFLNGSIWFIYRCSVKVYEFNYFLLKELNINILWGEYYGGVGISYGLIKLSNLVQVYSISSIRVFLISVVIWLVVFI